MTRLYLALAAMTVGLSSCLSMPRGWKGDAYKQHDLVTLSAGGDDGLTNRLVDRLGTLLGREGLLASDQTASLELFVDQAAPRHDGSQIFRVRIEVKPLRKSGGALQRFSVECSEADLQLCAEKIIKRADFGGRHPPG